MTAQDQTVVDTRRTETSPMSGTSSPTDIAAGCDTAGKPTARNPSIETPDALLNEFPDKNEGYNGEWQPSEADLVWCRFDKSKTQALGVILKIPVKTPVFNKQAPSVYCNEDGADRYLVAFIHSDSHVYPPRHYLVKFDLEKAAKLKCMRARLNSLTPWDKIKRRAIKDVIRWKKGEHNFEHSHDFTRCHTCCEEASDEFWTAMGLERGTVHLHSRRRKEQKKKGQVKEEGDQEEGSASSSSENSEAGGVSRSSAASGSTSGDVEASDDGSSSSSSGPLSPSSSDDEGGESSDDDSDQRSSHEVEERSRQRKKRSNVKGEKKKQVGLKKRKKKGSSSSPAKKPRPAPNTS